MLSQSGLEPPPRTKKWWKQLMSNAAETNSNPDLFSGIFRGCSCDAPCKSKLLLLISPHLFCLQVRSCVCWATTRMESGVRCGRRTARVGFPPTTSRQSTAWRSTVGTTGRSPAALQSTCFPPSSMAVFWSGKVKAALASCPSLCDTRGECTTTGSTRPLMER